ncbi:Uncharacterised protein [Mycobacteroides abscessus subsp. abscessus]|nr:Uncharacterised protein [Mycobacteroides abscessus subsp. abscessus]
MSENSAYTHTTIWSDGCCLKCGWRLTVQLISQLESRAVTMPPVTTLPLNGSRSQILWMYSGIRLSNVVTVHDSHLVLSISPAKTSGWPNAGSFAAMRRHRSQAGAGPRSSLAGVWWSPSSEFSVRDPMVMKTRSFSPRSMLPSSPLVV